MKVVVVKGSKFWGFVLRKMFHIKKRSVTGNFEQLIRKSQRGIPAGFFAEKGLLVGNLRRHAEVFLLFLSAQA
ncbi:hypothetical protein [Anaeromassilibacillus sp. SJQ-1]|uniref:hypothetical protein n=1 Tax=Anaeromassilibacillus sp. SJQ-1 TaxID=3375419 RepID=UPI0039890704